jgi:membrane associated rhomboid family serine protease
VALAALLTGAVLAVDAARALAEPAGFVETSLGRASIGTLLALGAKVSPWVWAGEVERLVLAGFLHSGLAHLALNALWLAGVSFAGAWVAGVPAAFAAAMAGNVAGFCVSVLAATGPSVGASAMILGGAGLLAAWLVARGGSLAGPKRVVALIALSGALLSTLAPGTGGHAGASVDHAAHVGGLVAGVSLGYLLIRGLVRAERAAALAAALLLGASALSLRHMLTGPAASELTVSATNPARALPELPLMGRLVDQRCVVGGDSAIACATDGLELLVLTGPPGALAQADARLAAAMPPPGRCARYSAPGEDVLVVRPTADDVTVLAILPQAAPRYAALRESLSAGRCPGK